MKLKNIAYAVVLAGTCCLSACNKPTTEESATTTEAAKTSSAPDSVSTEQLAYICPMKCEGSASHQPGKCPVCTMDLVKNPDYKEASADSVAL